MKNAKTVTRFGIILGIGLLIASLSPAAGAASGKVAEFKFDGDLTNSVGSSSIRMAQVKDPCTCVFGVYDVDGTPKMALDFGTGDGLKVTRIPLANRSTYSIDAFFELDDMTGYKRILSFGPNAMDRGLYFNSGLVNLYPKREGTIPVAANEWVHVLITRSGRGQVKVYIDGVLEFTYKDGKSQYTLKKGQTVFFKDEGTLEDSSGTVSDIRIYNRVLSPS